MEKCFFGIVFAGGVRNVGNYFFAVLIFGVKALRAVLFFKPQKIECGVFGNAVQPARKAAFTLERVDTVV